MLGFAMLACTCNLLNQPNGQGQATPTNSQGQSTPTHGSAQSTPTSTQPGGGALNVARGAELFHCGLHLVYLRLQESVFIFQQADMLDRRRRLVRRGQISAATGRPGSRAPLATGGLVAPGAGHLGRPAHRPARLADRAVPGRAAQPRRPRRACPNLR